MDAQAEKKRVVFMGTPPFAAAVLDQLALWPKGEIVGVYTQPDRPSNRGKKILPSAVKQRALQLGLPLFQPQNFKAESDVGTLASLRPDFLLVAAYGLLLPQSVLSIPVYPPLNVHASLLPQFRGAAPVQRAIMAGEEETGVSIMEMVRALDAGSVYLQKSIPIGEHTADSLLEALAVLGGEALLTVLEDLILGKASAIPQDEGKATYAAKLEKEDGMLVFNESAKSVHARIRAVTSKPSARCTLYFSGVEKSFPVQMLPGKIGEISEAPSGSLRIHRGNMEVACCDYWYVLGKVKPQGKDFIEPKAFVNGYVRDLPEGICGKVL